MRCTSIALAVALCLPTFAASAQMDESQKKESLVRALQIPETPAFSILEVTPSEVTRPGTGRDLAVGLLQGLDAYGNMQSGIAFEFSPYLINNRDISLSSYREDLWAKVASRTKLSFATSKGADEKDKSLRAALGLRTTLLDFGDPYLENAETDGCFDKAMRDTTAEATERDDIHRRVALKQLDEASASKLDAALNERMKPRIEKSADACRKEFEKSHWNSTALDLGVAPVWNSPDGTTQEFDHQGFAAWTSFQWGFEHQKITRAAEGCGKGIRQRLRTCASLQLLAKYRTNELVEDPLDSDAQVEQGSATAGLRFRYGSKRRTLLLESTYSDLDMRDRPDSHEWRYIIGGEFRLSDDMWLQLTYGTVSPENGTAEGVVSSQFAWAFGESSSLP